MDGSISFEGLLHGSIAEGGGGGGSTVEITPVVTSGTKIADVSVNGVEKDLYCPTPQEVIITPVVTSGTKIADVSVNGVEKDLYCPTPTEVNVTQVQSSGTKIASIGVNGVNTDIYAPSHEYSTTEHVVGVWIDGRPVYEKTIHVINTQNSFSDYITIEEIQNIDMLVTLVFSAKRLNAVGDKWYYSGNGSVYPETLQYNDYKIAVRISNSNLQYYISGYDGEISDLFITIRYTKSTDI